MASAALCFEILGEGMDGVFPSGSLLECVDYAELGREPEDGDYVLAEHISEIGETKISCYRYVTTDDGSMLINEPKETAYQREFPIAAFEGASGHKIIAYVMSYQLERPATGTGSLSS